jgi:hypothetical protein
MKVCYDDDNDYRQFIVPHGGNYVPQSAHHVAHGRLIIHVSV